MFKHIIIEYDNNDDEEKNDGDDDDEENNDLESEKNDIGVVAGNIETVELTVFVPCRDDWLSKDQIFYTDELRKFSEVERIENLWINSKSNYKVGSFLETNLKFQTRFANKIKNDAKYRQSLWDRIGIKDTCPDQGE